MNYAQDLSKECQKRSYQHKTTEKQKNWWKEVVDIIAST